MRQKDSIEGVAVFVAVADAGSFSEAARRLGLSPSAVSQAIGSLEQRLGVTLFRRSTRSLSLTDVGHDYLLATAPALAQLRRAAEEASGRAGRPSGPLRLTLPRAPFDLLMADTLVDFQQAYPEVDLEIAVEARRVDIVSQGYDAGVRYGNNLENDMVAISVAPAAQAVLVASPAYLDARGIPLHPEDLLDHRAVMCRSQSTGMLIPWILHSAGDVVRVAPKAATIIHDLASQIALTAKGLGILSAPATSVSAHLAAGTLSRVLSSWSSPLEALYLYFPSRRHQSAALRAFVAFLGSRRNDQERAARPARETMAEDSKVGPRS